MRIAKLAALAATAVAMFGATTGVASAANYDIDTTSVHTITASSGKVLDVEGAALGNGARIIQWWNNNGQNQIWRFVKLSPGDYQIRNQNSGKCITSVGVGRGVVQYTCDASAVNQHWFPTDEGGGFYRFRSEAAHGTLDLPGGTLFPGAQLITYGDNHGANQLFRVW
jgi:hypothetical protein